MKMYWCKWHCGPPMPEEDVFRRSTRAIPQCHPCARACEAIDKATSKAGPAHKKAWDEMKTKDFEQASMKVRASRIPYKQHTPEHAKGLVARTTVICEFVTQITQSIEVAHSDNIAWHNREDWLKYRTGQSDMPTKETIKAEFDEKLKECQGSRMNKLAPKDCERIPVYVMPTTQVIRRRKLSSTIQTSGHQISSALEAAAALKEVAAVGVGDTAVSPATFGSFAGLAAPSGLVGGAQRSLRAPIDVDELDIEDLGRLASFDLYAPKRLPQPGDPACEPVPVQQKRTGGPKLLQAVCGQLREVRAQGLALWKQMKDEHGDKKSVAKAAKHSLERWSRTGCPAMVLAMSGYKSVYETLKAEYDGIGDWTLSTCRVRLSVMSGLAAQLAAAGVDIRKHEEAEKEKFEATKLRTGEERKQAAKDFRAAAKMYRGVNGGGVPTAVLNWLHSHHMFVKRDEDVLGKTVQVGLEDSAFNHEVPCLLPPDCQADEAVKLRVAWQALKADEEGFQNTLSKCLGKLETAHADTGKGQWLLKVVGSPHDTYGDEDWVPARWKATEHLRPAGLQSFGSPWLLLDRPRSWRDSLNELPLSGLGQVWMQRQGCRIVIMWPIGGLLEDHGCHAAMSWHRLFQQVGAKALETFANKHFSVAVLRPGGLLWIPFGFQAASLAEMPEMGVASDEQQVVTTLVLPILSTHLAATTELFGDVENHLRTAVCLEMKAAADRGSKIGWHRVGKGLMAWMANVLQTAAVPGQAVMRPVIEDGPHENAVQARRLKRSASEGNDAALLGPAAKRADLGPGGSQQDALADGLETVVLEGEAWCVCRRWVVGG